MLKVNSAIFSGDCSNLIPEEDMEDHSNEVVTMFGEFSAGVDMTELEEGHMILDGYSVQEIHQDTNPPKDFTKEGFTKEESDLLNLEVTDEIEDLIYALAKEKGLVEKPLVEDILFEDPEPQIEGIDYERALIQAIPLFDKYFEISNQLDKAVDTTGWNALRSRRQLWWSHFQEEMDTNWLKLSAFEAKADRKLYLMEKKGVAPTDKQWQDFMNVRKNIMRDCFDMQNKRFNFTNGIYQKAIQVTAQAREFWNSPGGQEINRLRQIRSMLYQELVTPVLMKDGTKISYWDLISSYWQLREEELSPNFTTGDTSSVDDPEIVIETKSQIESLMDTHLLEETQIEKGDTYWMNWYDTWMNKRIEKRMDDMDNILLEQANLDSCEEFLQV